MTHMMKLLMLIIVLMMPVTAWSYPMDTLVTDVDPPSTGWWMKTNTFDTNPDPNLASSGEATEDAWVAGILGYAVDRIDKINDPVSGEKFADGYDPKFAWDFVIVKYDSVWALYQDGSGLEKDNLVTVGPFEWGISHMSFFGSTSTQVPEPLTLILLGVGLLGVVGLGRKK
jgi:hypothetical protein